jgi:hypothetical protein
MAKEQGFFVATAAFLRMSVESTLSIDFEKELQMVFVWNDFMLVDDGDPDVVFQRLYETLATRGSTCLSLPTSRSLSSSASS